MKPGDKVHYRHTYRAGYGYERKFPAVVMRVNPKSVHIRLGRVNTESNITEPFECNVSPDKLTPRHKDCAFESMLNLGILKHATKHELCNDDRAIQDPVRAHLISEGEARMGAATRKIVIGEVRAFSGEKELPEKYRVCLEVQKKNTPLTNPPLVIVEQPFDKGKRWDGTGGRFYLSEFMNSTSDNLAIDFGEKWYVVEVNEIREKLARFMSEMRPAVGKHNTPGPWMVSPCQNTHGDETVICTKGGYMVARIPSPAWKGKGDKEDPANAQLLAVAPKLLSSLANMLELFEGQVQTSVALSLEQRAARELIFSLTVGFLSDADFAKLGEVVQEQAKKKPSIGPRP